MQNLSRSLWYLHSRTSDTCSDWEGPWGGGVGQIYCTFLEHNQLYKTIQTEQTSALCSHLCNIIVKFVTKENVIETYLKTIGISAGGWLNTSLVSHFCSKQWLWLQNRGPVINLPPPQVNNLHPTTLAIWCRISIENGDFITSTSSLCMPSLLSSIHIWRQ